MHEFEKVAYTGAHGRCLAFVIEEKDDTRRDLVVFENGGWTVKTDVPRGDDGAGHTWAPVK